MRIRIAWDRGEVFGILNDTPTANELIKVLPCSSTAKIWVEEEERRLFYVAVTRAKDELYLAYPLFRMTGGDSGGFQRPSRFLAELPKSHYQELALRQKFGGW